ncbi:hypothetical protein ANN_08310 [Periplaneta americana]|uniref:Uncharacterized protein n=1 Tax=Periplaneta americana TaxID=6978 RepID=A0ABQ8T126_PERAM|nr:hypothetical protein ANN_08310 [Periplaneta americana]
MAGLCEGGNEPPGSLKAICNLKAVNVLRYIAFVDLDSSTLNPVARESCDPSHITLPTFQVHLGMAFARTLRSRGSRSEENSSIEDTKK